MGKRSKEKSPLKYHFKAIANHYLQRMQHGEIITLKELLNAVMIIETDIYLSLATDNQANRFYNLKLTMGNLDLKVPRVRFDNSFRPSTQWTLSISKIVGG